jgi:hypothetical protein
VFPVRYEVNSYVYQCVPYGSRKYKRLKLGGDQAYDRLSY